MASDADETVVAESGTTPTAGAREGAFLSWLGRLQIVILFAVLIVHPTDFAVDLGGERGEAQRHVIHSLGLMGKVSAQAKAPHLYVTLADVLIGIGFGVYVLRWLLRKQWRQMPPLPLPILLLVLWFLLSAVPFLKPRQGQGITFGGTGFYKELLQTFEYLVAAYLLFAEGFRCGRFRRAAAVLLMALATVVVAWAWWQYADVAGVPGVMEVSGPLSTRNSLGVALAMMLPFAFGVGIFSGRRLLMIWAVLLLIGGLGVTLSGGAFLAASLAVLALAFLRNRWAFVATGVGLTALVTCLGLSPRLPRDNFSILQDSVLLFRTDDPYRVLRWMERVPAKVKLSDSEPERQSWPWRQRYKEWQVALQMIGDSPLFGVGGGAFETNAGRYYNKTRYDGRSMPKMEVDLMEPEGQNFYLQLGATLGLPALLLILWLLLDHARTAAAGLSAEGVLRGAGAGALGAIIGFAVVSVFAEPLVRGAGVTFVVMLAMSRPLSSCAPSAATEYREEEPNE